jgi:hypothetical protein
MTLENHNTIRTVAVISLPFIMFFTLLYNGGKVSVNYAPPSEIVKTVTTTILMGKNLDTCLESGGNYIFMQAADEKTPYEKCRLPERELDLYK